MELVKDGPFIQVRWTFQDKKKLVSFNLGLGVQLEDSEAKAFAASMMT